MRFPDSSYAVTVGRWRHIQSIHEASERRNPDHLVRHLLPASQRWSAKWISRKQLDVLRSHPVYYYLVARTRYYDELFLDAIVRGVNHIINVGSGTDTRAYRFADRLKANGIQVCECDQPSLIFTKQSICQRRWPSSTVSYLPLDLGDEAWPGFELWLDKHVAGRTLVLMEGLTPYLDERNVSNFLDVLAHNLPEGSFVAYDFKILGINDDFGRGTRTQRPFRLPSLPEAVAKYHEARGYRLTRMELSDELSMRLLPDLTAAERPLFREDALIQLELS